MRKLVLRMTNNTFPVCASIIDTNTNCPNDWYKLDDECYVLYDDNVQKNANIGQSYCNVAQSNLASFISKSHLDSFISE